MSGHKDIENIQGEPVGHSVNREIDEAMQDPELDKGEHHPVISLKTTKYKKGVISNFDKADIISAHEGGMSISEIGYLVSRKPKTVEKVIIDSGRLTDTIPTQDTGSTERPGNVAEGTKPPTPPETPRKIDSKPLDFRTQDYTDRISTLMDELDKVARFVKHADEQEDEEIRRLIDNEIHKILWKMES